jgi:hypothetical protein
MKIRMKTILAGPAGTLDVGDHDLPTDEALRLVACGVAISLEPPPVPEEIETAATEQAGETADTRKRRSKKWVLK